MTNTKQNLILSIALISMVACGPSKEQQAAEEKRKNDSIAQAAKTELLHQQAVDDSVKSDKMVKEVTNELTKSSLVDAKGKLAAAESKMEDIKAYHIGRSHADKDKQIEEQTKVIEELKNQIADLEKETAK